MKSNLLICALVFGSAIACSHPTSKGSVVASSSEASASDINRDLFGYFASFGLFASINFNTSSQDVLKAKSLFSSLYAPISASVRHTAKANDLRYLEGDKTKSLLKGLDDVQSRARDAESHGGEVDLVTLRAYDDVANKILADLDSADFQAPMWAEVVASAKTAVTKAKADLEPLIVTAANAASQGSK